MALQDILNKIQQDADAEIASITAAATAEIEAIKSKNALVMEERIEAAKHDRERRAHKVAERVLSKARHESTFIETAATQSALEAVYRAVEAKLSDLDADTYTTFLKTKWASLPESADASFVTASERAAETKAFLQKNGVSEAVITEKQNLGGGFIMTTATREYDCSFAAFIANVRNTSAATISQKLLA